MRKFVQFLKIVEIPRTGNLQIKEILSKPNSVSAWKKIKYYISHRCDNNTREISPENDFSLIKNYTIWSLTFNKKH